MTKDPMIQSIESFRCHRGQALAERRNCGYTLHRASFDAPVGRLRPTGQDDRGRGLWKERWTRAGPFGRTVLPINQARKVIV